MKVNRQDLLWFVKNIRRKSNYKQLSDEKLVNELANYMETNPGCIDTVGVSNPGRFSYSTVGYGVMSLLGEKYSMGRIEVFDKQDESGYAMHEGIYTMPHVAAQQFQDFIESLETDLPINIEIGSHQLCAEGCARSLGFESVEDMHDKTKVAEYTKKKNDENARERGYRDWDDLIANNEYLNKK